MRYFEDSWDSVVCCWNCMWNVVWQWLSWMTDEMFMWIHPSAEMKSSSKQKKLLSCSYSVNKYNHQHVLTIGLTRTLLYKVWTQQENFLKMFSSHEKRDVFISSENYLLYHPKQKLFCIITITSEMFKLHLILLSFVMLKIKGWVEPIALWDTQTLHTLLGKKVKCDELWVLDSILKNCLCQTCSMKGDMSKNDCIILSCLI